jgi:hypothetical protein
MVRTLFVIAVAVCLARCLYHRANRESNGLPSNTFLCPLVYWTSDFCATRFSPTCPSFALERTSSVAATR